LRKYFVVRGGRKLLRFRGVTSDGQGVIRAVDGVWLTLGRRQTLGLVGESGSGKTTLARVILRLVPPTSGRVLFDGCDAFALSGRELRRLRRRMQIIFQDPAGSLNPRLTVEQAIGEVLQVHGLAKSRRERTEQVVELLRLVGLPPEACGRYPHEFSGGQRQRIVIARALAAGPELLICDEPVSALDVSVQAQILNLLSDLQAELGLSYLLIAHNLAVVRHCSDYVAVMYRGRIVEYGPAEAVYESPQHPYTRLLLGAAPRIEEGAGSASAVALPGECSDRGESVGGCNFAARCPSAERTCLEEAPPLAGRWGLACGHLVACHFAGRVCGS
jgi:oligopeptide transport system ATP-binding protein